MHTGRGCELAPGLPCALLFFEGGSDNSSGAFAPRECGGVFGAQARHPPAVIVRQPVRPSAGRMTGSGGRSSIPEKAKRNREASAYWIARSRLRQPPSSEGGLRRVKRLRRACGIRRAEALAEAASRATTKLRSGARIRATGGGHDDRVCGAGVRMTSRLRCRSKAFLPRLFCRGLFASRKTRGPEHVALFA